ncbi:MAG: Ig-like domain-containing protein [Bacteroidales bacterium]|nr:Ig-like domain-containing protein [Bacteroidales bacterium]
MNKIKQLTPVAAMAVLLLGAQSCKKDSDPNIVYKDVVNEQTVNSIVDKIVDDVLVTTKLLPSQDFLLKVGSSQSVAEVSVSGKSDIDFVSSDASVATVDSDGKIVALSSGECTISAISGNSVVAQYLVEAYKYGYAKCDGEYLFPFDACFDFYDEDDINPHDVYLVPVNEQKNWKQLHSDNKITDGFVNLAMYFSEKQYPKVVDAFSAYCGLKYIAKDKEKSSVTFDGEVLKVSVTGTSGKKNYEFCFEGPVTIIEKQ